MVVPFRVCGMAYTLRMSASVTATLRASTGGS